MANILLKKIPPELHEAIRQSAREHHRSMNGQILHLLEKALLPAASEYPEPAKPSPQPPPPRSENPPAPPSPQKVEDLPDHLL